MKFLIYSQQESNSFGSPSFWSNDFGWTSRDEATEFDSDEQAPQKMLMPQPDGVVISVEQADDGVPLFVFGRRQAINDGVLVDLTAQCPQEVKLFNFPVACTEAVWSLIERACEPSKESCSGLAGVVWDLLWMASRAVLERPESSVVMFDAIITGVGVAKKHAFKMEVGPDDNLAPCLTIMFPQED